MADPFVGEIRMFAGNFAPRGWATCNGQLLQIAQNTALYSLLGTMYGGDGRRTFALPNLQGAAPLMMGQGPGLSQYMQGETGGEQTVTLTQAEMPQHSHTVNANGGGGDQNSPAGNVWAAARGGGQGANMNTQNRGNPAQMNQQAIGISGGGQPHNNMPPYLVVTFIIALQGVFPPRS
jgi:microcystin-dependent protein